MSNSGNKESPWNSLEIAKLLIAALIPISIFLVGHNLERSSARSQQAIKIYNEVGPKLNSLLAYYTYVGKWKEMSPLQVIKLKRDLDAAMHTNRPMLSENLFKEYNKFMNTLFHTYQEWGKDAKLNTGWIKRKPAFEVSNKGKTWSSEWNERFSGEDFSPTRMKNARSTYAALMARFADELDLKGDKFLGIF